MPERAPLGAGVAVDVSVSASGWTAALPDAEGLCRRAAVAAFLSASAKLRGEAEISIVLADDDFQRDLNRRYRDRDAATNVLAFPAQGPSDDDGAARTPESPRMLGDIIVAFETAAAEAERDARPLADHLSHLVVHGVLHLLGHDHQGAAEADVMERLETGILAGIGVADPYEGGAGEAELDQ